MLARIRSARLRTSCPGCDPGIRRRGNEFGNKQKKTDRDAVCSPIHGPNVSSTLPPQPAHGHSDFSVLIMKSVITIAGEEQGTIKINPLRVASQEASGSD